MGRVEVYSDFWQKQVKKYGLDDGIDTIIRILKDLNAYDYFELGIGTGWPIASSLIDAGKSVYGCDLSSRSVLNAINDYPQLYGKVYAGSIGEYDKHDVKKFDCVYCIRSSWYMRDFPIKELRSMLDITKTGGYVVFNILNSESRDNKRSFGRVVRDFMRAVIHRIICGLKVVFMDEDYAGRIKEFYFSDNEIRSNLEECEIRAISINQLKDGMDNDYDSNSQKILYLVRKG